MAKARAQTVRTSSEMSVPSLPPEPPHVDGIDAPPAWPLELPKQNKTKPTHSE